jgi:Ca2+-binding EF-hand superfamily protein
MSNKRMLFAALAVGAALSIPLLAQAGRAAEPKPNNAMFARLDTNADGKVTFEEFKQMASRRKGADEARMRKRFDRMDANHDGVLQPEEVARPRRGKPSTMPAK